MGVGASRESFAPGVSLIKEGIMWCEAVKILNDDWGETPDA